LIKNINTASVIKPQGKFLVVCCFIAYVFSACKNDLSKLPPDSQQDWESDRATDVTFIYSQKGKTKARLKTKEFIKNDQAKPPFVDMLHHVNVDFYDDSLQVESTLTARYARYYTKAENVLVRDSVVVINNRGEKLETEELVWNQKMGKFYSDKFIKITAQGQVSYGDGLEANEDFSWFRIENQRGTIPVDKNDLPTAE
jgi:LPS export ABC transporter protein LptC